LLKIIFLFLFKNQCLYIHALRHQQWIDSSGKSLGPLKQVSRVRFFLTLFRSRYRVWSRGFVFLTFWFFASRSFFHNQCRDQRVSGGDHHPHLNPTGSGPSIVTPLNDTSSTSATWPYSARNCNLRFHILEFEKKNQQKTIKMVLRMSNEEQHQVEEWGRGGYKGVSVCEFGFIDTVRLIATARNKVC
jgi:hypothetical protein